MTDLLITDVRPLGGSPADLLLRGGRIAALQAGLAAQAPVAPRLEGQGRLLLPGLVEPHTHADKTLWGLPWRPHGAGDTLESLIQNERRVLAETAAPTIERAAALLRQMVRLGTTAVRCHVDVHPEAGVASVEALLQLKRDLAHLLDLQLVAFPQQGLLIRPGTYELMDEALRLGVETVGGLDPCGIEQDPVRHLEAVFGLAAKHGRGVDIHLHDLGTQGLWQVGRIVDFTALHGLEGRVMISHAFCLGSVHWDQVAPLAERLARHGVAIMTTAPADCPAPPVKPLLAAGVTVCSGNDGIRDAWSPFGNGDQLERALFVALRFDWRRDEDLALAFDCVSGQAAKALGLADYGLAPGARGDLVLVAAETLGAAVVERPAARTVIRNGRVVADEGRMVG